MQETRTRARKITCSTELQPTPVFCNAGELGSIPGLGRSTGEKNGYPLPYSGLENSMDYTAYEITESDTAEWLSLSLFLSRILAWRGPWGHRVGHNWATSTLTQCIQFSLNKSSVLTLLKCVWIAPVHILGWESSRRYKVSLCHIKYQPIFNKKLISLCLEHKLWRPGSFSTGFATVL